MCSVRNQIWQVYFLAHNLEGTFLFIKKSGFIGILLYDGPDILFNTTWMFQILS